MSKKWSQLFAPFFIIPPILTFILFDLRHDWLQLKSITLYLNQDQPSLAMWERINSRLSLVLSGGMRFVTFSGWIASVILCLIGYMGYQSGFARIRLAIRLLLFWLVGWWITTLLYSGTVWTYYFSPFFNIFLFVTALVAAKSQIIRAVLGIGIFLSLIFSVANNIQSESSFDHSSWKLLQQIAQETLSHPNAGYFLYSQDQFAYSLKYAFKWVEKNDETISAFPFEKQRNTVLVKSADDPNNPYMSATLWQVQQINLNKAPDRSIVYPHGYTVEYYTLTDEEIAEPIDPNLILDLHFR